METANLKAQYILTRVLDKLNLIPVYPLTAVVAPMGYGKTTAVRSWLGERPQLWISCQENEPDGFWRKFCKAVEQKNHLLGGRLAEAGLPTGRVLSDALEPLLVENCLPDGTILVIDDYQWASTKAVDALLEFWVQEMGKRYPVVLISRTSGALTDQNLLLHGTLNLITTAQLAFLPKDISAYYAHCGYPIADAEAALLYQYSEGWVALLYLYLLEYAENGTLSMNVNVRDLLLRTVYDPLPEDCKEFLWHLIIAQDFTRAEARFLWQKPDADALLDLLVQKNAFLSYYPITKLYHFHNLFVDSVDEGFAALPMPRQSQIWLRQGQFYASQEEWPEAMDAFFRAGDFDGLLAALESDCNRSTTRLSAVTVQRYFDACPADIRLRHPAALLLYARRLHSMNRPDLWRPLCDDFLEAIARGSYSEDKRGDLMAHYELFLGITSYNDVAQMDVHHRKAAQWAAGRPLSTGTRAAYTFGSPSVLAMFLRTPGDANALVPLLYAAMEVYTPLMNGHGAGAAAVLEAELCYLRGAFAEAEIAAHKSQQQAREHRQWPILLIGAFTEARISFYKGDWPRVRYLLEDMRALAKTCGEYMLPDTIDLCEGWFYALLGKPELCAPWLKNGDFSDLRVTFPGIPTVNVIYGAVLLAQGEYARLLAKEDRFLAQTEVFPSSLTQLYLRLELSAAALALGRHEQAAQHWQQALALALPDGLLLPFAELGGHLAPLLLARNEKSPLPDAARAQRDTLAVAIRRMESACFKQNRLGLTEREFEIAALAATGLPRKELATRLFVSENTIKSSMKSIFAKLEIKSRVELLPKLQAELRKNDK